ncbi:MAG: hypothetical protein ACSW8H_07285, partial [bacterium]
GYRSGHNGVVLKTIRAVMSTRVRILHPPPFSQSASDFASLADFFFSSGYQKKAVKGGCLVGEKLERKRSEAHFYSM